MGEAKIVWKEGNEIRSLKGKIVERDKNFIKLSRYDGTIFEIPLDNVLKIIISP